MKKNNNKKLKVLFIIVSIIFVVTISYTGYDYFFVYHIKMNGDKIIKSNLNDSFNDPGLTIRYRGKYIKNYKTNSNINVDKEGKYSVEYLVGKKKLTREVDVEDIKGPNIYLKGGNLFVLSFGKEYTDPGYTAIDNTDGDVTDKVTVKGEVDDKKLGEYSVIYTVEDSKHNISEIERVVKIIDDDSPVFKFKKPLNTYAIKGKSIDLNDYIVTDNYDGDLTDKVVVSGEVDVNKEGIYKIEYSVVDNNGNKATEVRTVNVQNKNTKGVPVLMYHWFYDDTKGEKPGKSNPHNFISKTHLLEQVKYLKEENYYYPTWQELIDYIDKKIDLPEKSVIITDDDCVKSFFDVALPIFQENEIPVTSFCVTKKEPWKKYIGAPYLDFESHTENLHVRKCKDTKWDGAVMCSDYDTIYKDIKKSVEKVGSSYAFAYPFGHYNDDTIKALKNNGIRLAFTINSGKVKKGSNKYKLRRVRISKDTSIEKYKSLLTN